ncbi:hypothetical protein ACX80I_00985 [Arthrobacter sp. MDT3-44]
MTTQKKTTLDSDVTKPSVTQPGDGPADTTDPTQRATSVTPQPGEEALKAGTVNAVRLVPGPPPAPPIENPRIERYTTIAPNGDEVTVTHNLDTGETIVDRGDAADA